MKETLRYKSRKHSKIQLNINEFGHTLAFLKWQHVKKSWQISTVIQLVTYESSSFFTFGFCNAVWNNSRWGHIWMASLKLTTPIVQHKNFWVFQHWHHSKFWSFSQVFCRLQIFSRFVYIRGCVIECEKVPICAIK